MSKGEKILQNYYANERIDYLDASVTSRTIIDDYLYKRKPVIIRGLIDDWEAINKWSFSWFQEKYGNIYTNVFASGNEAKSSQMRLKKMFAKMQQGEILYSSLYTKELFPILSPDYPLAGTILSDPKFNWLLDLPKTIHGEMNVIFIGNTGTGIKNHQDSMGTHLWSAQIMGTKRWIVSPPEESEFMYEGKADWLKREKSIEKYPKFKEAKALDFILETGEILILPVGWWHQTEIISDSISITHDLVNETNYHHYIDELNQSHHIDPKVETFYRASQSIQANWYAQLPQIKTTPIERISYSISFEELLEKYLIPHQPVILQNQINHWPALHKWNLDYFRERFGNAFIQYFHGHDDKSKKIRLRKYLETKFDQPHYSMWCLDEFYDILAEDFETIEPLNNQEKDWILELPKQELNALTWIFMGTKGSGIANHSDRLGQHVYSAQISGRKRWLLHPPEDKKWMYDGQVDLTNPDLVKYPLYMNASAPYDFVLEPGEVLILPNAWWHQTLTLSDSISLSHDFMNVSNIDSFLERMEARKGENYMKSETMKPIISHWKEKRDAFRQQKSDHKLIVETV